MANILNKKLIFLQVIFLSCTAVKEPDKPVPIEALFVRELNQEFWDNVNPIEFVDSLKLAYQKDIVYMINERPKREWFKPEMVKELNLLINDTSACYYFFSRSYNTMPLKLKTSVGSQVKLILKNYGMFPANFISYK